MKPILRVAAAAGLFALGACSASLSDVPASGRAGYSNVAAPAAGAALPQFAASSAALPAILADGSAKKVTYVPRSAAVVTGGSAGYCPYTQSVVTGTYTASAGALRPLEDRRTYRFTNY